ncbi:hypothetical protein C5167_048244 [Papaver somniferum]|uniref:Uncharacterized protein n=1 Tax=Papaver somniferum TaxID=3469 RepID=A0A4Y7KHD5_PAPSO|nr:hypothetical protein C5167_048244 [Papaver somniferum]
MNRGSIIYLFVQFIVHLAYIQISSQALFVSCDDKTSIVHSHYSSARHGDEANRKSLKEELLKIVEKDNGKQNVETKAKVIDENDGLIVDKQNDWEEFKARQEAIRKSLEEPPLKKKKSEEKNGNQNDEAKEGFRG